MGKITLAVAASHAPGLIGMLDDAPAESRQMVLDSYGKLAEELREKKPDVLIMIANDHLANNRISDYPDFLVGLADTHKGPSEFFKGWLACDEYEVPGRPDLASILFNGLNQRGVRASGRRENLHFDDNISVPLVRTEIEESGIPIIPVLQNVTVPPVPDQFACYEVGKVIAKIVEEDFPDDISVGLFATGGLSHEPGGLRDFWIDEEFDRWFLQLLADGDHRKVLEEVTLEKLNEAGESGTGELLSWIVAMGAIGEVECNVLGYTAWDQWRCGIGAVSWNVNRQLTLKK
ncbi:DODA-type extradiol aromatic ring-opening family dioxygenase [Corynebacterium sp. S7]